MTTRNRKSLDCDSKLFWAMIMTLFEKIPMSFEGRNYEIRVLYDDTTINVVAFLNNHPANGLRHQVKISKQVDIKGVLEMDAANELVEM